MSSFRGVKQVEYETSHTLRYKRAKAKIKRRKENKIIAKAEGTLRHVGYKESFERQRKHKSFLVSRW